MDNNRRSKITAFTLLVTLTWLSVSQADGDAGKNMTAIKPDSYDAEFQPTNDPR